MINFPILVMLLCVILHSTAIHTIEDSNINNKLEAYIDSILQTVTQNTETLKAKKSVYYATWYELLIDLGRLQACIDLGLVADQEALDNIRGSMSNIKQSFDLATNSCMRQTTLSILKDNKQ